MERGLCWASEYFNAVQASEMMMTAERGGSHALGDRPVSGLNLVDLAPAVVNEVVIALHQWLDLPHLG